MAEDIVIGRREAPVDQPAPGKPEVVNERVVEIRWNEPQGRAEDQPDTPHDRGPLRHVPPLQQAYESDDGDGEPEGDPDAGPDELGRQCDDPPHRAPAEHPPRAGPAALIDPVAEPVDSAREGERRQDRDDELADHDDRTGAGGAPDSSEASRFAPGSDIIPV
jgi:hypothetical protein